MRVEKKAQKKPKKPNPKPAHPKAQKAQSPKSPAHYRDGREGVEDDPRSGCPRTIYSDRNIELVRQFVERNPHSICQEVEAATSINHFSLLQILHQALNLRKLASR